MNINKVIDFNIQINLILKNNKKIILNYAMIKLHNFLIPHQ